jgi:hypothetical protein
MATWHQKRSPYVVEAYKPTTQYKVVTNPTNGGMSVRGFPFAQAARDFKDACNADLVTYVGIDPTLAIEVRELESGEVVDTFVGISPAEAVMASYAQNKRRDFNTWDYYKKYSSQVVFGARSVECGGFAALRPN